MKITYFVRKGSVSRASPGRSHSQEQKADSSPPNNSHAGKLDGLLNTSQVRLDRQIFEEASRSPIENRARAIHD